MEGGPPEIISGPIGKDPERGGTSLQAFRPRRVADTRRSPGYDGAARAADAPVALRQRRGAGPTPDRLPTVLSQILPRYGAHDPDFLARGSPLPRTTMN